ncbi:hypothetical protein [Lysobacter sp. Root690]|uniref:AbiJ-NTD4 domain-containing protein n=1 Tax=Lysobacter sp. Root690 TaxID=1736588 RepID=UPI000ACB4126|nr:hypothetical protein [Lysobacter sp. Root690]
MRFSERNGQSTIRTGIQFESMDDPLRNSLWNALQIFVWDIYSYDGINSQTSRSGLNRFFRSLWIDFFLIPADTIPFRTRDAIASIREHFFTSKWFKVYDLIEFVIPTLEKNKGDFIKYCNKVLEREIAGYQIVGERVTPVTSVSEVRAIETALLQNVPGCSAQVHIQHSLDLLSKKPSPDYRNSIKESISAVESAVKYLTGDASATLGAALSKLSKQHPIHPSFEKGLKALYGYTSDANGIRHALTEQSNSTFSEAKFMLVVCSAFVNYLLENSANSQQP